MITWTPTGEVLRCDYCGTWTADIHYLKNKYRHFKQVCVSCKNEREVDSDEAFAYILQ